MKKVKEYDITRARCCVKKDDEEYVSITIENDKMFNFNIPAYCHLDGIQYPIKELVIDVNHFAYLYIPKTIKYLEIRCEGPSELDVDGDNPFYSYDGKGALLKKLENGGYRYIRYIQNAGDRNYHIPKCVKEIASYAFCNAETLHKLFINNELEHISSHGIHGAYNLKEIVFDKDAKLKEISEYAIYNCWALRKIAIPSSLEKIGFKGLDINFVCLDEDTHGNQKGTLFHRKTKKIMYYGSKEKKLVIPYGIESIEQRIYTAKATTIYLPETIKISRFDLYHYPNAIFYIDMSSKYFYENVDVSMIRDFKSEHAFFNEPDEVFIEQGYSLKQIEDIRKKFSIYDDAKWKYSDFPSVYSVYEVNE